MPAAGSLHQVSPVSVSLLAAQRHGGSDAGVGLSALRHHGESGYLPAGTPTAEPRWHGGLGGDSFSGWGGNHVHRRLSGHSPYQYQEDVGLLHHHGAGHL